MYRNRDSLLPIQYFNKLPKECTSDVAIILEPMIATGTKTIRYYYNNKNWKIMMMMMM